MLRRGAYRRPSSTAGLPILSPERDSRSCVRLSLKLGVPVLYVRFVHKPEPTTRTLRHNRRPFLSPYASGALRARRDSTQNRDNRERNALRLTVGQLKLF